jgi:hypothetical protein
MAPGGAERLLDVPADGLDDVTLEVRAAAIVRGAVLDAAGAPRPGVDVHATAKGELPDWVVATSRTSTRTASDGTFRFDRLMPGVRPTSGPPARR